MIDRLRKQGIGSVQGPDELQTRIRELERQVAMNADLETALHELEKKYEESVERRDCQARQLFGIRSMIGMPELILDESWHIVGFSPDFPLFTHNIYEYANRNKHIKELIGERNFDRIVNYMENVRTLEDLPYDEGAPWDLAYEGPGISDRIDDSWVQYRNSPKCRWDIVEIDGKRCFQHQPHVQDEVDCYLMSVEEYGGADEDIRVLFRTRTSRLEENIRDLSIILSGASGAEKTNPDYIGYTICTAAAVNRYARIQKYCANLFLRPETLRTDTEYEIVVERTGGRIQRSLTNLTTQESFPLLTTIDSHAVYDGQNHIGFTTYSGEALFYDIKIFKRKSRFPIEKFKITFDLELEIDEENLKGKVFRLKIGRDRSMFKPLYILLLEDITQRKEAERALLASEEKYRALFEESKDALCVISRDGRFIEANPAMLSLFGYTKNEFHRLDASGIFVNPADQRRFLRDVEKAGSVRDYEIKLKKNNSTVMDCVCNSTLRLDRNGIIWGYQTTITDITERKRLMKKDTPFFGANSAMAKIRELASLAAENDTPVTLTGETGTGKGLLARWIHENSRRNSRPFVEINCSCLKGEMLASELFGHLRGAFTSAVQDRKGLIHLADGGTLFLDEIGNMSIGVQAEFLKVIEEKEYRRLGEDRVRKSDFRLICSTNMDLFEETRKGTFRQDLFFRINVFPIHIPPLRKRMEDFESLVQYILGTLGAPNLEVSAEVMHQLGHYSWPGNIRELRNLLERALILCRGCKLSIKDFPGIEAIAPPAARSRLYLDMRDQEKDHILEMIEKMGGNKIKAAKMLGISRATLYRKLRDISRPSTAT